MRAFLIVSLCMVLAPSMVAEDRKAIPAYGWLQYCGQTFDPSCRLSKHWTAEDLAWVNVSVNGDMKTGDDPADVWQSFPIENGDCEDAALSKRAALIALGFPPESLTLVAGEYNFDDGSSYGHMVLEASLGGNNVWVLDINSDALYRPENPAPEWSEKARQVHGRVEWADTSEPEEEEEEVVESDVSG